MASVLIVDDDKFTRTVLTSALAEDETFTRLALRTHTAADGEQGLLEFRKHHPDVVIVDLLMPNVDGWALCRAIRAEPSGGDVHLIAMSGVSRDPGVADKLHDEVGAEFFTKPYQLRDMTRRVAAVLEQTARGGQSGPVRAPRSARQAKPRAGDLANRPLPAVLFDFLEAEATGQLTLKRGRIAKVIELVVGHPFSVSSTARDEALGHFLVSFGVLTEDQHRRAVRRAAAKREKVSDAMIALRFISPEDMVTQLTMHTCYRLTQSLRWGSGAWRFQPHQGGSGPRGNPIDMIALVLQGLRHTASLDRVPPRVAEVESQPLALTPRGHKMLPAIRQYLSAPLVDHWHDGATVQGLLGAVDGSELYVTLEALLLCDAIIECDAPPEIAYDAAAEATLAAMTGSSMAASPSRDTGDISVERLSAHAQTRRHQTRPPDPGGKLYSMLFDDMASMPPQAAGELPIELPDEEVENFDSGVIDVSQIHGKLRAAVKDGDDNYARRLLLKEYLRVQGTDHYAVLGVKPEATAQDLTTAHAERKNKFSFEWFSRYDLGRDYAKLEEIHAVYDNAFRILSDDGERAAYDRSLTGDDRAHSEPGLAAEMAFHAGTDLLQHGSFEGAIEQFKAALAAAPDEALYHALLGWAHYLKGGRTPRAADEARPHLNQGLLINPDHAVSHEYKGLISATLGDDDDEAIFHLERALEADPGRIQALRTLDKLRRRRGELRPLERQYRRLIYRVAGSNQDMELDLWLELAELYRSELAEPDNARVAYESAARLAPDHPRLRAAGHGSEHRESGRFDDRARVLRQRWRRDPTAAQPGIDLMHLADREGRPDAAFMIASALVARGCADQAADELYLRHRPRFVIRAQRPLAAAHWSLIRHAHDLSELCRLFELLRPAIEASFSLSPADLDIDESMAVSEEDLPEAFTRVRAYVGQMLDVPLPRVFLRPDFGRQIHVGAVVPPVLLAGDEVLTSPERSELAFRLGRAMTYLLPGRTFAGSRPSRLLKAAVLAVFATLDPGAPLADDEGYVAAVRAQLAALGPDVLREAQALVARLTQRTNALNLSLWARALARTADRVGLLLAGDLPAAVRFARASASAEAADDLIDFAIGANCWQLRADLGLSIAV